MKVKTQKIIKRVSICLLSLSCLVAVGVATNRSFNWVSKVQGFFTKDDVNIDDDSSLDVNGIEIKENGIKIKYVSSYKNSEGNDVKTFTYTINPDNATFKEVGISLSYSDGTACSDVMEASIDQQTKTITLTCLQAFDKQIILKVYSTKWTDVYSTLIIDYEEKVSSISPNSTTIEYDGDYNYVADKTNSSSGIKNIFSWTGSKHTIEKTDQTWSLSGGDITITNDDLYYDIAGLGSEGTEFINKYVNLVKNALLSEPLYSNDHTVYIKSQIDSVSASEVWNLTTSESIHSYLASFWEEGQDQEIYEASYIIFTISNMIATSSDGAELSLSLTMKSSVIRNYSSLYVKISSIGLEETSVIF